MRVKNYDEFQHFKNRTPPWIKFYRSTLDDREINKLSDTTYRVLMGCWLLASEDKTHTGNLPSVDDIAFRLRKPKQQIVKALQELESFIVQDDDSPISSCHQDDAPEERRVEVEEKGVYGEFENVFLTATEYDKLVAIHGGGKVNAGIEKLSAYIASKGRKYKSHYATMHKGSWVWDGIKASTGTGRPGFTH